MIKSLVSVMIPCFNRADLLSEALASVMNQSTDDVFHEIWVVDDHSTKDNPEDVVKQYPAGTVNFFRQPQNVGQINNLNKCIELAKGKLVHILHCDDRVLPGFYKAIREAYFQSPDCGAYFTRNNYINDNGSFASESPSLRHGSGFIGNWFELISTGQRIQTPSMVVKKEVYDKLGGFSQGLTWTEDWEMWVRISKHYKVYYIDDVLAEYRLVSGSNSADSFKTGRFITDLNMAVKYIFKHHQSNRIKNKSLIHYSEFILNHINRIRISKETNNKEARILLRKYFHSDFFLKNPFCGIGQMFKIHFRTIRSRYFSTLKKCLFQMIKR